MWQRRGELDARSEAELAIDPIEMRFNCLVRKKELLADLAIAQPGRGHLSDLQFLWTQTIARVGYALRAFSPDARNSRRAISARP
jgi:hypothetical protein